MGGEFEQIVLQWVTYLREQKLYGNNAPLFPRTRVVADSNLSFGASGIEPVAWASAGQIRSIFKAAFQEAGIPYFNPHSFRDTLAIMG